MNLKIEHRYLQLTEAKSFAQHMEQSPFMMSLTPKKLIAQPAFLATIDHQLVGLLCFFKYGKWREFGPIYVLPEYRNQGIAKALIHASRKVLIKNRIFITTHNEKMVRMAKELGFAQIRWFEMPLAIALAKFQYILSPYTVRQKLARLLGLIRLEKMDAKVTDPYYGVKL